ncbi:MAG: CarD family transcriptional regulator [Candidatus Adiutrix sp.]|nr:CarD family transcriptional regulator [Candidatus Adiutrix sp.]
MRLKPGDLAVYPAHGVGRIEAVEQRPVGDKVYDFFVMHILENGMKIMIPAQNVAEIGLRPLIKKAEVAKVYEVFKTPRKLPDTTNWNRRHREYMEKVKTGSPLEVAEVMRELLAMRAEKDLSFGERKLLDMVKVLLVTELALACGRGEAEVAAEIEGFFPPAKTAGPKP